MVNLRLIRLQQTPMKGDRRTERFPLRVGYISSGGLVTPLVQIENSRYSTVFLRAPSPRCDKPVKVKDVRALHNSPGDEVSGPGGYCGREPQVHHANTFIRGTSPVCFEWRTAHQKLVCQYTQTPNIGGFVVLSPLHHFRRQIIESPA